ncbi:hypothetical protein PSm6_23290 [Pseudomonas solani]|uniref:GNAT family N-acetyltransferase n=1 Tax=Pseudomonas solani TaxID=2731552 RepID=A0AAU7Y419_9PSED|nr:GNAT family N-acetyltransferase [Pseudomonas solani]EQM70421.1 hypothetical protein L682_08785 [Pseudomonas alcaligenes OT 69]MDN4143751.1 GNAT family N-acetyltransferase [Pseudomonas tohonis]BCD85922.1 hypothetical protein PSm6_23290 [Pseudomonas solani]
MVIRKMEPADIDAVSTLCMAAFNASVAPTLPAQGIETFAKVAAAEAFLQRLQGDNLMLVYEDAGSLRGILELKEGRHLAMLFIDPEHQRQGIGQALVTAMTAHARVDPITVRASLTSVGAYLRYGFQCSGEPGEFAGLTYQPMELQVTRPGQARP